MYQREPSRRSTRARTSSGHSTGTGLTKLTVSSAVTLNTRCSSGRWPRQSSSTAAVQPPCATSGPPSWSRGQVSSKHAVPSSSSRSCRTPSRQEPAARHAPHSATPPGVRGGSWKSAPAHGPDPGTVLDMLELLVSDIGKQRAQLPGDELDLAGDHLLGHPGQ